MTAVLSLAQREDLRNGSNKTAENIVVNEIKLGLDSSCSKVYTLFKNREPIPEIKTIKVDINGIPNDKKAIQQMVFSNDPIGLVIVFSSIKSFITLSKV